MNRNATPTGSSSLEQLPGRKKKWAARVRTGCLRCRSRRVKCDEGQPGCQRCLKAGYSCSGYAVAAPSRDSVLHVVIDIAPKYELKTRNSSLFCDIQDPGHTVDVESPEWELMESFRYSYSAIAPNRESELDTATCRSYLTVSTVNHPSFIASALSHRIANTSKVQGRFIRPGEDATLSRAWTIYFKHLVTLIEAVNSALHSHGQDFTSPEVFCRIVDLVELELRVQGSAWQAHMEGFLVFLQHFGGVQAVLDCPRPPVPYFQMIFIHGLAANTTSPVRNRITRFDDVDDDHIRTLVGDDLFRDMPCPTDLLIQIAHINKLRVLAANANGSRRQQASIQALSQDIFKAVASFDPGNWKESYALPEAPSIPLLASVYKTAVVMYGALSLSSSASVSWASYFSPGPACNIMHARNLSDFMNQLRELWSLCEYRAALCWPLVVAGVALANGPFEDQVFVSDCVQQIWLDPIAYCGPSLCLHKLRIFWHSGRTEWEDCFDEPIPPIP